MGYDYVKYAGHHERFNDFDLWTLKAFFSSGRRGPLMQLAACPSADTTALRDFFEAWEWPGPGVFMGTDFSRFISDRHGRWELVLEVMQRAGDRIAAFGDYVPLDYLAAHVSTATEWFTKP